MHTGYIKVKCYKCRGTYRLYGDMVYHERANSCPFCGAEIYRGTWDRVVIPAFAAMEDANMDLLREHTGYPDIPLFQISYLAHKSPERRKAIKHE